MNIREIDGLAQDCSNSIGNTLGLLQSRIKPSIYPFVHSLPVIKCGILPLPITPLTRDSVEISVVYGMGAVTTKIPR